jgi:hypothetical protein
VLLDLDHAAITPGVSVSWQNCIVDRTQGALIGLKEYGDGARLWALEWTETNMIYAGQGAYVTEHHHDPILLEADWNYRLRIGPHDHRLIEQRAFPETRVRSGLTLSAVDLDPKILEAGSCLDPELVGEGVAYAAFRKDPAYRDWRRQVRASTSTWEQHRGSKPTVASR